MSDSDFCRRCARVLRQANRLCHSGTDWLTLHRSVLGIEGIARKIFAKPEEYERFEKSSTRRAIVRMVDYLKRNPPSGKREGKADKRPAIDRPTRVITVRITDRLFDQLHAESADRRTSMNKLCVEKLSVPDSVRSDAVTPPTPKQVHPVHQRFASTSNR